MVFSAIWSIKIITNISSPLLSRCMPSLGRVSFRVYGQFIPIFWLYGLWIYGHFGYMVNFSRTKPWTLYPKPGVCVICPQNEAYVSLEKISKGSQSHNSHLKKNSHFRNRVDSSFYHVLLVQYKSVSTLSDTARNRLQGEFQDSPDLFTVKSIGYNAKNWL